MSPVPTRARLAEYAAKGAHLALRQVAAAPEQRAARALAAQAPSAPPTGKTVLVLTPRSWSVHVQWDAMVAHALRLRGADVRFLTCGGGLEVCDRVNTWEGPPPPCGSCAGYVHDSIDAHGFPRSAVREGWAGDDPGDWPELDELGFGELADVADAGLPLGRLVEIPVSWFLMGSDLGRDPLAPLTVRRFLRSARRIARGIGAALDRERPDVVLLVNGLFLFEAIAWELCRRRGIDVVSYERGFVKETLLFRRDAPACLGDVGEQWADRASRPLTAVEAATLDAYLDDRRNGRRTIDRYWDDVRFDAVERRRPGRLAVLFPNLTWDSAVIGQGEAFPDLRSWVAAAVEAFAARPDDELVVRVHPAESKLPGKQTREPVAAFLAERFPALPPNVRVIPPGDPTSSYPLMAAADVGLVFSSTTGLELALTGTPAIVAARTHYRGKGFTTDVSTPEELVAALDRALDDPAALAPDVELARRYAHLFFFEAPVRSPGVEEHVPGLARITTTDLADLAPGRNPDVDRICDLVLGDG